MITNKQQLQEYLVADAKHFTIQRQNWKTTKYNIFSNPISDNKYIWKYIVALRKTELCINSTNIIRHSFFRFYWLWRLRRLSYKTGFQIPPNTCGKGLTIFHWGWIVINGKTKIGENCTLYPGVLIGHKSPAIGKSATIGNNVFIGAGTKIIGGVTIGDNVTIGVNTVITKDVPSNVVIGGNLYRIIRYL